MYVPFKNKIIEALKKTIASVIDKNELKNKYSPEVKIAQRHIFNHYGSIAKNNTFIPLNETGFRCFSQFEEDGILLYIFSVIGQGKRTFVDIGAGDGINSNCANLAINFGWDGLFIDGNENNVMRGVEFYSKHPDTMAFPPRFVHSFIQRENINKIIEENGFSGPVDLVSIDIDGNDYWVWDALTCIDPRVVIIETHIEFGLNSIVVPYDKDYHYPGKHPEYHGASPVAMAKLAKTKGYRLVGANNYGFNTIYVKNGVGENPLPEVTVESILRHPRNKDRYKLFDPIKDWPYIKV